MSPFGEAAPDLAWAAGVAGFAEILKHSPYASSAQLDSLDALFRAQAGRDAERGQFYELFQLAKPRLLAPSARY